MNNKRHKYVALAVVIALAASLSVVAPVQTVAAASDAKVDVVVAGYINHGPMQPTVSAIKEVLAKYGDKVSVTWIDLATSQGQAYFSAHGLSAHMNILINGKYSYRINGKDVTFQWFEGQQWTKADLDAVLASLVGSSGNASPAATTTPKPSTNAKTSSSASSKTQIVSRSANVTSNQTNTVVALPNNANTQPSTPGFEAVFGVVALGIVALALILKRTK